MPWLTHDVNAGRGIIALRPLFAHASTRNLGRWAAAARHARGGDDAPNVLGGQRMEHDYVVYAV